MKKGALFDMDGTLIDTEKIYRKYWKMGVETEGFTFNPDFWKEIAGVSGERALAVINEFFPGIDAPHMKNNVHNWVTEEMKRNIPERPGMREILVYLKENGCKLALASSSAHEKINTFIEKCHLEGIFDALVSGQDMKRSKPEPDIFLKAAEEIGVDPKNCYVFEDGINGVKAGIAAGCATIMIPEYVQPSEEERKQCVGIYDSLLDALEAIKAEEV
jgi:HAD superfamily hydrolase (TIGR01509 family)